MSDRCPGVLHAVAARDGLLVRVRVPGGALDAAQACGLADAAARFGGGALDLTARGGVQLRGIAPDGLAPLTDALARVGLLPSAAHDRVRNIAASPFAGCDPDELVDASPIVRELDQLLLADPALAALPAKFAFAIDGGGRPFPFRRVDLALRAVPHDGAALFALRAGGRSTAVAIAPERAAQALIGAARAVLPHVDPAPPVPWRLDRSPDARRAVLTAVAPYAVPLDVDAPEPAGAYDVPLGVLASARAARVTIAPSIPLGRLRAEQLHALAVLAARHGAALRITPWRTIVLTGYPSASLDDARTALAAAELSLDGSDGYHGIAACAGLHGCTAALADVRADAAELARRFAGRKPHGRLIHLAGCAKRCAMRGRAAVDLVADADGYVLLLDGVATRRGVAPSAAIAHAVDAVLPPRTPETS